MSILLKFHGSVNLYEFEEYLNIAIAFTFCSAFLLNLSDLLEIYSKSDKIIRKKLLINNICCFFTLIFNAILFMNKVKNKNIIENQIELEKNQILLDFSVFL